jgi:hypothetical protein
MNSRTIYEWLNGGYTGTGENKGNTTDTVHISLLIWCWTTFCLQYNRSPSWNGLIQVLNSVAKIYTILSEEHFQVALEMLEVGICSSL